MSPSRRLIECYMDRHRGTRSLLGDVVVRMDVDWLRRELDAYGVWTKLETFDLLLTPLRPASRLPS